VPEAGTGARRLRGRRPHGSARRLDRPPAAKPEPPGRVPRPDGRQAPAHGVLRDADLSQGAPVLDRGRRDQPRRDPRRRYAPRLHARCARPPAADVGGQGRDVFPGPDRADRARRALSAPAARPGLARGDRVLAINGQRLRDAIDFGFHAGEETLALTVEREGAALTLPLERRGADLGVELEPPRAGEIATCANKCVFCFIHQLPKGMRRSLYVKDDDFRLSFLHGNYITLTDLDEAAF